MSSSPNIPFHFEEYFSSGFDESTSPFLKPKSRQWGKKLSLRVSLLSSLFFSFALLFSFVYPPLTNFFLIWVYFLAGTPALIESFDDLLQGKINIDLLMTLAACLSVFIGSALEGGLLLVLFSVSASIEKVVSQKTRSTLDSLSELCPSFANIQLADGSLLEKSTREILPGEKLLVKAGEIVPLDSKVLDGSCFITIAHLTGESQPIPKKTGDLVQGGSLVSDGYLLLEVEKKSTDSTVSRIIDLIRQAEESKPKIERLFDRFGSIYASTIISLCFLFAVGLPFFFHLPFLGLEGSIYRSLAFLVAASPCALIIAIPTAYLCAISACAKRGILLKGGTTLDGLSQCKQIAFDKTGTLTTGKLHSLPPQAIEKGDFSEQELFSAVISLEQLVVHPIAEAICLEAKNKGASILPVEDAKVIPGSGVSAKITLGGKKIAAFVGHRQFVSDALGKEIVFPTPYTAAFLALDKALYLFPLTDTPRKEAKETISLLEKKYKLSCCMVTGDHKQSAKEVAELLGIATYWSDLRPENKLSLISQLSQKEPLIMIGDGINDAPALTRAQIGISMGGQVGSKTAMEASDIILLAEDLSVLPWLIGKARHTRYVIIQNLTLALSVILLATTPTLLGYIPLWLAVILHEGGTLLVGLNSLRLLGSGNKIIRN